MASEQQQWIEELKEFLRIPSVSTDPSHRKDVRRAAEWVRARLVRAGFPAAGLIEGEGHPLVYGDRFDAPGRPTLLFYGHYDVQPAEPLEEWHSPPFEPTVRNGNIYARGAVDDKGQVLLWILALEKLIQRYGRLPVNVRVLIEGEEEVGGAHVEHYVKTHASELKADAAVICDTEMFAPGLPTICLGLRGIVYGEIHVSIGEQDLHSGVFGGAVGNPIQALGHIFSALKDRDGRIQIPGFYDRVVPPSPQEKAAWRQLPFDERKYAAREARVWALTGEPEFSVLERLWARPTFEVHGVRGGFTGEGAKTVIPARAVAKVSTRLVPEQKAEEAAQQLARAVTAVTPSWARSEFKLIHGADPSLVDPGSPFIARAAEALREVFEREPVFTRGGGSIPIVGLFQKALGIPSVLMGFGLPDDNLHAPNEKFHLANLFAGVEAVSRYLEKLGE